jgi:myosin heavy subunit
MFFLVKTYIGDILIAMNPLKAISIYGKKVSNHYQKCDNVRARLPPHIYATAEQCFREMTRTQQSQCILISGISFFLFFIIEFSYLQAKAAAAKLKHVNI